MIEAEKIAEALKPSKGSRFARRNRLIKKALAEEFGRDNVSVKGDRGTAYGWVIITVKAKKPHEGECGAFCSECNETIQAIKKRVWGILRETGLENEIGTYYNDAGAKRKECIVRVVLYG